MSEVATVKEKVEGMIKQLDELQLMQVVTALGLTIKDTKKSRKEAMRNVVKRYLSSEDLEESEDEGLAVFMKLEGELQAILADSLESADDKTQIEMLKKTVDELLRRDKCQSIKSLDGSSGSSGGGVAESQEDMEGKVGKKSSKQLGNSGRDQRTSDGVRLDLNRVKLREFKITNGSVGAEEGCLPYSTVCFQMKEAEEAGCTPREIRSGVIKAMKTGFTRVYFEGKADEFTHEEFMDMLREVYDRKLSSDLMDDMGSCIQKSDQKERQYVLEMLGKRDHILKVTESEEEPLSKKAVQKKMLHAMSVGLRKESDAEYNFQEL